MIINALLTPRVAAGWRHAPQSIHLVWDSETGTILGPDAELLLDLVRRYAGSKFGVPSRLPPDKLTITDPLRQPVDMAILLGYDYTLPPELEALYPDLADETPEGAVN